MSTNKMILSNTPCDITEKAYRDYASLIHSYISNRIGNRYEAKDLTHDVFVRTIEHDLHLQPSTIKYFLFAIARNIVTDYLRRHNRRKILTTYLYDTGAIQHNEPEEQIVTNNIIYLEKIKLNSFAPQRKMVYIMSRYEENSISEIAKRLNISKRTVQNHLLLGRKIMRTYLKECIA